jgi:hypothetical protein
MYRRADVFIGDQPDVAFLNHIRPVAVAAVDGTLCVDALALVIIDTVDSSISVYCQRIS